MNYSNLYVNLLNKYGSKEKPLSYSERHHIMPKALGGDDSPDNLIYLPARVHFIVHWIIYKIAPCEVTARAFYGMCDVHRRPDRKVNSVNYEIAKKAFSRFNHMKSKEYREHFSELAKNQWATRYDEMKLSNAWMFTDTSHPMYMKNKFGDLHPRSKAVITPLGRFGSVREAGRAHNIAHYTISRFCKSDNYPGFNYEITNSV